MQKNECEAINEDSQVQSDTNIWEFVLCSVGLCILLVNTNKVKYLYIFSILAHYFQKASNLLW